MTLIARALNRNRTVARRFGARADSYDGHAGLQRAVAERLAAMLPEREAPSVLEIGCGTGFLTRFLLNAYPDGDFLITDLAPEMLAQCRKQFQDSGRGIPRFAVMDGEAPDCHERFDLVVSSMALQWFSEPLAGLERLQELLKPGGALVYATLGPEGFPEWRGALAAEGLPEGTVAMPALPGVIEAERRTLAYDSGRGFLEAVRAIGAGEPRAGYRPLPPGGLRRALRRFEAENAARVTWHIVYGALEPDSPELR